MALTLELKESREKKNNSNGKKKNKEFGQIWLDLNYFGFEPLLQLPITRYFKYC